MDMNVITSAVDKKYTEFSGSVKAELQNKLANHEVMVQYANEYDNIQTMKSQFSEINSASEE